MRRDLSSVDAARTCIDRGRSVVPIPAGRKGPTIPGWQDLRIGSDDAAKYIIGGCNVGVILGPASGELVGIDLDCPEALALADKQLRAADQKAHALAERLFTRRGPA